MSASHTSVIVVTYNSRNQIADCMFAIPTECELIIVDNCSGDGTADFVADQFPHVHLIRNETNRGYGPANNQGLQTASREFALILNPDVISRADAVENLQSFMQEHPDCIASGGKLLHQDGSLQESACNELSLWVVFCEQTRLEKLFRNSRIFSPYWISKRLLKQNQNSPQRVSQVMGACLMLRRANGEFILFDERYNLYCEDTDLCRRLSHHGEIWYVPTAEFSHALGASSTGNRALAIRLYNAGKERYFRIHHGPGAAFLCFLLNRAGSLGMTIAWTLATLLTLFAWPPARGKLVLFGKVLLGPLNPELPQSGS